MSDVSTELIRACQLGDRAAQRVLYDLFHERVYRLVLRMVGQQDAADVTQQVFLQVLRNIGSFQGCSKFETWLYRVGVNESLQHLRRRRRWTMRPLRREPVDAARASQERASEFELLERAIGRLDPLLRSVFVLRELESLSYREISQALDIAEGTVGSRLNRARHELQQHLRSLGWEP